MGTSKVTKCQNYFVGIYKILELGIKTDRVPRSLSEENCDCIDNFDFKESFKILSYEAFSGTNFSISLVVFK